MKGLVWAVALVLALSPVAQLQAEGRIAVDGRALGPDGLGLAGARVELRPVLSRYEQGIREAEGTGEPAPEVAAVTRADGRFTLAAPREGMWTVTVRAAGFVPVRVSLLPLLEPVTLPDAELRRDAGLRLRIEDAEGRPVPGAHVAGQVDEAGEMDEAGETGAKDEPVAGWQPLPRRAVAGADGEVHLARAEGETLRVWAVAEGYAVGEAEPASPGPSPPGPLSHPHSRRPGEGEPPTLLASSSWAAAPLSRAGVSAGGRGDGGEGPKAVRVPLHHSPPREILVHEADGSAPSGPSGVIARDPRSGLVLGMIRPGKERTAVSVRADDAETVILLETADGRRASLLPRAVRAARLPAPALKTGRVVDPGHLGIAGAWVWPRGEPALAVRSDAGGGYRLAAAVLEGDGLKAAASGYWEAEVEQVPLQAPTLPTLILTPAAVVAGIVVDLHDRPVEGALVLIENPAGPRAWTSAAGTFRMAGLSAEGVFRVTARHPCCGTAEAAVSAGASGARLVLRPGTNVTGTVVDEEGRPVAGVEVEIDRRDRKDRWDDGDKARLGQARTDTEGRFALSSLPAGAAEMCIRRAGALPFVRPGIEIPPNGNADLGRIMIPTGAALTGRVTDPGGLPLAGAEVWVANAGRPYHPWPSEPSVVAGADGGIAISGLPSGELHVAVCHAGSFPQLLEWASVPPEPVTITLAPASGLRGTVVDAEGRPLAGARAHAGRPMLREGEHADLSSLNSPPCAHGEDAAITDAEGRFALAPLEPDFYVLFVGAEGFRRHRQENVEVPAAGPADLTVVLERGASLSGTVTGAQGEPVAGASVSSLMAGGDATTDIDGKYRIEGIETGKIWLSLSHREYESLYQEVEIAAGDNTVDLRMTPSEKDEPENHAVRGRVLDPRGGPVSNAQVAAGTSLAATATDGSFVLSLSDGEYSLSAQADGAAPGWTEEAVVVDGAPVEGVEIRLGNGAVLTGRLLGLEPAELAWARVQAAPEGDSGATRAGTVAADGSYRIGPLGPGDWTVSAWSGDRSAEAAVALKTGDREVTVDDLRFAPRFAVSGLAVDPQGAPVPEAEISFRNEDSGLFSTVTRSDGSFAIRLEDGTYDLHTPGRDVTPPALVVAGAPVAGLEIRLGKMASLTIHVLGIAPEAIQSLELRIDGAVFRTQRTADGVFSFQGLSRGTWTVTVNRIGEDALGKPLPSVDMDVTIDGVHDVDVGMRMP